MEEEININDISDILPEKNKNILNSKVKNIIKYDDVMNKELQEIKDLNFNKTKKYDLLSNIDISITKNQQEIEVKYKKLIGEIKKMFLEKYLFIRYAINDLDLEIRKKRYIQQL